MPTCYGSPSGRGKTGAVVSGGWSIALQPLTSAVPLTTWFIVVLAVWLCWAWLAHRLLDNPRGDAETGLLWPVLVLYTRLVHRLEVSGREHLPPAGGPLVLVANHTAGVDPLLVQRACPFFVRWMMADDMQLPGLEPFWRWVGVIGVDRHGREIAAAREAIRHVRGGGVVGIFPEGTLERPPRHILPFLPGVGLIVHKSEAAVLPVVIDGTPRADRAWTSLWRPSRAKVRFLPMVDYARSGRKPAAIAQDLRERFAAATGWPMADAPDPDGLVADK